MELMKGYKRTEVGVIPEDWDLVSYGEAFNFLPTATYSRSQLTKNGSVKYVHYGDIHTIFHNFLKVIDVLPTVPNDLAKKYALVKHGDIIMADASEDTEGVGKSVVVLNEDDLNCISGLHTYLLRDNGGLFSTLFKAYISSNVLVKKSFDRLATGMKVFGVSKQNLKLVQIPLPPVPEQKAIARVLSDTDTLIQALQNKINKKRDIKQGAMQQLLKPKEGWERKKLGEVADFLDNLRKPIKSRDRESMRGDYPYYGASGIIDFVNDYLFDDVLILLGEDGENILSRNSPLAFKVTGKIWVNNHAHVLKPRKGYHIDYLSEYLESLDYSLLNSGTAQPKLNKKACSSIIVQAPSYSEQERIATILSDIDSEIDQLQEKLSKYQKIKQGLMQNLLTGKIRLV